MKPGDFFPQATHLYGPLIPRFVAGTIRHIPFLQLFTIPSCLQSRQFQRPQQDAGSFVIDQFHSRRYGAVARKAGAPAPFLPASLVGQLSPEGGTAPQRLECFISLAYRLSFEYLPAQQRPSIFLRVALRSL